MFNHRDILFFVSIFIIEICPLCSSHISCFFIISICFVIISYFYAIFWESIIFYLNEGKSFSYALSRLPEYFDESDAAIVKTGENTGTLDVVLQELANEYTYLGSIKNRYKSALTYPIILIIMAFGAVIFLFSSVLPSILEMVAGDQQLPQITLILKSVSDFFV